MYNSYIHKDLDEVYFDMISMLFNRYPGSGFLTHWEGSKKTFYLRDLHIIVEKPKCTLDISKLNYRIQKWKQLLNKYIDFEKLNEFYELVEEGSASAITFYFKKHQGKQACLTTMVLTKSSGKVYDRVTFTYRAADMIKRFPVDLVLFYHLVKELNTRGCDIKQISIDIPLATYYPIRMAELIGSGYFTLDWFKKDNEPTQVLMEYYKRYYTPGSPIATRKEIARKQRLKFSGKKLPPLTIDTLKLEED